MGYPTRSIQTKIKKSNLTVTPHLSSHKNVKFKYSHSQVKEMPDCTFIGKILQFYMEFLQKLTLIKKTIWIGMWT